MLNRGQERMWGAGVGLRNLVLMAVGTLLAVLLVLGAMLIERAYDWRTRGDPRRLPRDLAVAEIPPRIIGNPGLFFGPETYPLEALRQNWEGRSSVALLVDEEGRPTACEVVTSSGHDILDRTTCRLAVEHMRYAPARDRRGQPIKAISPALNVRWQLPSER